MASLLVVVECLPLAASPLEDTAEIEVIDAALWLEPTAADYEAGFVEAQASEGITVRVKTTSTSGLILSIRCGGGEPGIAPSDILFRTLTMPEGFGGSASQYTTLTLADQLLWTMNRSSPTWLKVETDIKVINLWSYPGGGAPTSYTTSLVYTVVMQ